MDSARGERDEVNWFMEFDSPAKCGYRKTSNKLAGDNKFQTSLRPGCYLRQAVIRGRRLLDVLRYCVLASVPYLLVSARCITLGFHITESNIVTSSTRLRA